MKIKATFEVVLAPSSDEDVTVRARLDAGGTVLEWNGSVRCAPGDTEVITAELSSGGPLSNQEGCLDTADIEFSASPPGEPFASVGKSANVLYVVLGDPAGTPAYWTLLDISCRAAAGSTTAQEVVERSFVPFTSRTLTRLRDGKGLTYWNPDTTTATNTQKLLASGDGSGQCGAWSEFLIDMYKAHGIGATDKVIVVRTIADFSGFITGFLVKNWQFVGAGSQPAPFTHKLGAECIKIPGIPGQRNPNPPPAFYNHFIVKAFGKFYDRSYGGGPIAGQTEWEVGAIDGLSRVDTPAIRGVRGITPAIQRARTSPRSCCSFSMQQPEHRCESSGDADLDGPGRSRSLLLCLLRRQQHRHYELPHRRPGRIDDRSKAR